ncbi:hypothetical protein ABPG72_006938 [Tetrahymena utriculariae]
MIKKFLLALLAFTQAILAAQDPQGQLLQVVETFRHGARYRIYNSSYPDNNQINYGELTAEGQRMHYVLGVTLQQNYANRLNFPQTYDHTFLYAKSTNVNRTIMSAYSQLAGMFPLNKGLSVENTVEQFKIPPFYPQLAHVNEEIYALAGGQQPIPIHVKEQKDEKQLLGYMDACQNAKQWSKNNKDDSDWNRIKGEFQPLIDKLANDKYFELPANPDLDLISELVDTLVAIKWAGDTDKNNEIEVHIDGFNLPLDEMINPINFNTMWVQMNLLYTIQLHLALFKTQQQKKTSVTPFFNELLAYFNNYLNANDSNPYFKWIMLSAHDTTIAMVAQGLNLTSWQCMELVKNQNFVSNPSSPCIYTYPGFASNIIFELYEDANKKPYVKALYNGTEQPLCGTADTFCYLDQLAQSISYSIVSDFDEECGNPIYVSSPDSSSTPTWAIVVIVVVSVLFLGALGYIFFQRRKILSLQSINRNSSYSQI